MAIFAENFWDQDFNSTNGYEVLMKRTKDGRDMCKDYEDFLKQRSRAERTYGDNLIRLAKNSGGKDEIGGLKASWDELIKQTENVGLKHMELSNQMLDEAKKVEEFRETHREFRKKPNDIIRGAQNAKREWHGKVVQSKKSYENKCREKDAAEEACVRNRQSMLPKDVEKQEKLQQRSDKAKQSYETTEATYKSNVKTLEDMRVQWEEQMVEFCATIQHMEEERIKFLRGNIWSFTNINSLQCVYDDQVYETVRQVLEDCDEHEDISQFVNHKGTSRHRPGAIVFEDYYKDKVDSSPHGSVNGTQARKLPQPPGGNQSPLQRNRSESDSTYAVVDDMMAANANRQKVP